MEKYDKKIINKSLYSKYQIFFHSHDTYIYSYKLTTKNNEWPSVLMVYKLIDRLMLNSTKYFL